MKIAYYCSNRTVFPPPKNIVAANATVMEDITKAMIKKGHEVTIFASKGSSLKGTKMIDLGLLPHQFDSAYEKEEWVKDLHAGYRLHYISELINRSDQFDIIHLHVGRVLYGAPFVKFAKCPVVFTVHENLDLPLKDIYRQFQDAQLVSISMAQRKAMPKLNFVKNIYHGVDTKRLKFDQTGGDKYLFLGRVNKLKGADIAVRIAKKAKIGLDLFGPVNKEFLKEIMDKNIKYRGVASKFSKVWKQAYSKAKALIFPIQWEEPFGLVMIEAMAFGTPVIAYSRGSVPELIREGETGFICDPGDEKCMIQAIQTIEKMEPKEYGLMRQNCRRHVEEKFTLERMANEYETLYQKLLKK